MQSIPLKRYDICDRKKKIKFSAASFLNLTIEHAESADKCIWLPAPERGSYLILRCYATKLKALAGEFMPPVGKRINWIA